MWSDFDKFDDVLGKFLPDFGEGETVATQISTAVNKLVYKYFNDGDVFDNTKYLSGWCNDLSSYANWLYSNVPETKEILDRIYNCFAENEYEELLFDLCSVTAIPEKLDTWNKIEKAGSIYSCEGKFKFEEYEDDEDDWWDDEDEDY